MFEQEHVYGPEGFLGTLEEHERTPALRLDSGERVPVDLARLERRPDGTCFLPFTSEDLRRPVATSSKIPVVEERISVEKRPTVTGKLVVRVEPKERTESVDLSHFEESADVQRVEVNRFVDQAPPVRRKEDVVIIPVMEEVLVVERRLMVREEIRVRIRTRQRQETEDVTRRVEEAHVTREETPADINRRKGEKS